MSYTLRALTEHGTGAEITGLDLSKPRDRTLCDALNEAFARYHVLVFRGQSLTPEQFARAGEIFGEIMPQHHKQLRASDTVEDPRSP